MSHGLHFVDDESAPMGAVHHVHDGPAHGHGPRGDIEQRLRAALRRLQPPRPYRGSYNTSLDSQGNSPDPSDDEDEGASPPGRSGSDIRFGPAELLERRRQMEPSERGMSPAGQHPNPVIPHIMQAIRQSAPCCAFHAIGMMIDLGILPPRPPPLPGHSNDHPYHQVPEVGEMVQLTDPVDMRRLRVAQNLAQLEHQNEALGLEIATLTSHLQQLRQALRQNNESNPRQVAL